MANNTHENGILENAGKGITGADELGLALRNGPQGVAIKNGVGAGQTVSAETLRRMAESANGRNVSNSFNYDTEITETSAQVFFDRAGGDPIEPASTPSEYVEALTESLSDTFNAPEFFECLADAGIPLEIRPARTQPNPVIIHELADRTVAFDSAKGFIDAASAPTGTTGKVTIKGGSEIHLTSTKAIQYGFTQRVYDVVLMGQGFTESTLTIAVENAIHDATMNLAKGIAEVLSAAEGTKGVSVAPLDSSGKTMAQLSESIIDAVAMAAPETGYADELDDVAILMPTTVQNLLAREAMKNGFEDVETMLGSTVLPFKPKDASDTAIYIISKRLLSLSFRQAKDMSGDTFKVLCSRDPNSQSWVIEGIGVLDLLCDAAVRFNNDSAKEETAKIKHIVKLTFDAKTESSISIPGITK